MANAELFEALPFEVNGLENIWKKRTKEFQSPRSNSDTWPADQQQDLRAEREELEDELRQLRKRFADMELADVRATTELKQLLSCPLTNRDGSPDMEELFAEANRRNTEFRRIKADRERPGQDKKTILHEMKKIQIKLEDLGRPYALVRKENTRRLGGKLQQLYGRKSQPDYSGSKHHDDAARTQNESMVGRSNLATKELSGFSGFPFASAHEHRRKRSRDISIETVGSTEFKQSATPRRPTTNRNSAVPVTKPHRKLSKLSPVIFRSQQGRYKIERARPGRNWLTPTGHQNQRRALSPTLTKFEHAHTSLLLDTYANGENESSGCYYPKSTKDWLSSAAQAREDSGNFVDGSVRCARLGVPYKQCRNNNKRGVGVKWTPESDLNLPTVKRQKAESTYVSTKITPQTKDGDVMRGGFRTVENLPGRNIQHIIYCHK